MTFQERYSKILSVCEKEINDVVENLTKGIELQEPLNSKLLGILNAPSKYIRSLVSFLFLKACGFEINRNQILYQSAIELVHNASLIHDDVIDESNQRRGLNTLNNEFGNKLAVISGDYLLSKALDKVVGIGNMDLVKIFSETLAVMSEGEVMQQFAKFKIPSLEEYLGKSYKKTAKLFETAICGSTIIAQMPASSAETFAKNFGIAFQIRDDLINCKTSQSDIKDGVYTAPVIFSGGVDVSLEGIEKTKNLLNNYVVKALGIVENFDDSQYKVALVELLGLMSDE